MVNCKALLWLAATVSAASVIPGPAIAAPFTWDLTSVGGSKFTADTIAMTTFFNGLAPPGGGNTPETFVFQINAFQLGGVDVTPAGLGSAYGLYITADVNVTAANVYTKIDIALKLDPGNHDGAASASLAGTGFANTGATGAADDVTLATGSIVSGSFGVQSNGRPGAHFVETFTPAVGESALFPIPAGTQQTIEEFLFNTATSRVQGTLPDGSVYTLVNNGTSTADISVPEPGSFPALAGVACLALVLRRRGRFSAAWRRTVRHLNRPCWLGAALSVASVAHGAALAATFSWDPSKTTPALTSGPAAFSADAMSLTNAIRTTNVDDFATLKQNSTGTQYEIINGFSLGGAPVAVPGLNSAYGLYFRIGVSTAFPINASGATVGPPAYSALDVQLIADVGHDDGSLVDNAAGIGFANSAGLLNDVVLATGSLVSASLALNPATGTRSAHYVMTFQPVASEAAFFAASSVGVNVDFALMTPGTDFQVVPIDALTVLNIGGANGTASGTAQLVPEPATMTLLGAGLLGLAMARRRRGG